MINFNRLKKSEILWLFNNYCRHGHRYTEHMACFNKEKDTVSCPDYLDEHIGYLDIETTGLKANFDFIISYSIVSNKGQYYGRALKPNECRDWRILDKNLMKDFIKDIKQFDRVVVYWGKDRRHDLPFLRTRSLKWWRDFPLYKEVWVTDLYDIVKNKLRLHRSGLQNACEFFGIASKEHRTDWTIWQKARLGHKESLEHIWKHNVEDVDSTKELYELLDRYSATRRCSI